MVYICIMVSVGCFADVERAGEGIDGLVQQAWCACAPSVGPVHPWIEKQSFTRFPFYGQQARGPPLLLYM